MSPQTKPDCRWPNVKAVTAYRKGCRCDRCRVGYSEYKRDWRARGGEGPDREREASLDWKYANRERNRARDRAYSRARRAAA